MKLFKKITALAVATAITLSSVTFSNAAAVSEEAKKLNQLNLLLNITEKEMSQNLNRMFGITMVMKALGYKDEDVKTKAADNPFNDLNKDAWVKGFAAVAYENNITKGISGNPKDRKFGPYLPLTKKEMLTFMLRVLGYNADEAWRNTEAVSRQAGILTENSEIDSNFTKDDAAKIMFKAMSANLVNSEGRLIDRLINRGKVKKDEAIKVGLVEKEVPKTLAIESVTADNLRQIKVVFNRELNADSAKKLSNYSLKGTRGVSSRSISEATLAKDNRTVLLTVGVPLSSSQNPSVLEFRKSYILTVKDVKDLSNQVLPKTEMEFTADDVTPLKVTAIEFTGPRNARVVFNEPVKSTGSVEIRQNNNRISTSGLVIDPAQANVVLINTYNTFKPGVSYRFEVQGMKDFAGYTNIAEVQDVVFQADNSLPSVSVVAADQGKVEVVFDRPVKGLTAKHFYHGYPHQTAKEIYKDAGLKQRVTESEFVSKVWVVFATGFATGDYPLPPQTEFYLMGKVGSRQIVDTWGNKLADYRQVLSVQTDNSVPAITDLDVQETQIIVTFNKTLSQAGTYRILNSNGSRTLATPSVSLNGNKVTLRFSKLNNVREAILEVKGARDNTFSRLLLVSDTRRIEFTDRSFDGIVSADYRNRIEGSNIVGGEIYVGYNEPVANNAIEGKNYQLNIAGQIVGLQDQELAFGHNNRTVVIRLDEALAKRVNANLSQTTITASSNVTDVNGNSSYNFATSARLSSVQPASLVKSVLVRESGVTTLQLHFSRGINNILNISGFKVGVKPNASYVNGEAANIVDFAINDVVVNNNDNKIVEVRFSQDVYAVDNLAVHVDSNSLEDVQGNNVLAFNTSNIVDKIGPTFLVRDNKVVAEAYKSGNDYFVSVEYTEPISVNSLSSGTYRIEGDRFTISDRPTVDGNKVVIKVVPAADAEFTPIIYVVQQQAIQDTLGNEMTANNTLNEVKKADTWVK